MWASAIPTRAEYAARNGGRVEAVFLSHLHDDHAGGLEEVLESASVGAIYVPAGWEAYDVEEDSASALVAAREAGIPVVALSAGDEVRLSEGVTAAVLAPDLAAEESGEDANAISMVLEVRYGAAAALFTGDLPADCEPDSLPDIDLLKVAHHGSAGSTSSVFLAQNRAFRGRDQRGGRQSIWASGGRNARKAGKRGRGGFSHGLERRYRVRVV